MSTEDETVVDEPMPFYTLLREHRGGGLAIDAADAIAEVVQAVHQHGKKGSVTITFSVEPAKDGVQIVLYDEVKSKVPQESALPSLFFVRASGQLSRRDPRQPEIPGMHAVPSTPDTPRERGQEA